MSPQRISEQPVGEREGEHGHRYHRVHAEEGCPEARQVVGPDQKVLPEQKTRRGGHLVDYEPDTILARAFA